MNIDAAVEAIKSRHQVERWGIFKPQHCHAAPNGRPRDEVRIAARERGLKRFHGSPCQKCGSTERYTNNGSCINCKRMLTKRYKQCA